MKAIDFEKFKEHIRNGRHTYDVGTASKNMGLSTSVFYNAMKRNSFEELTSSETSVLEEMIRIIDLRRAKLQRLAQSYSNHQ